jgi:dTDP-4-dehydrorhamnose 3,5-epimerase
MKIVGCDIPGVLLIEPKVFGDRRGFFLETWNQQRYREAGIEATFVQDNLSFSGRGTLRGLHFQNPAPQAKLVSVLQGKAFDAVVDVRRKSPTFRQWRGFSLSSEDKRQLFVPAGLAHGFQVLSETVLFHYKCSGFYSPKDEITIRWDDPDLAIVWPLANPVLSDKDARAPTLRDVPLERLFD